MKILQCESLLGARWLQSLLNDTTLRVPNRFFGIRDLAYLKAGIRDFGEKEERDSGLQFFNGTRDLAIKRSGTREMSF